MKEIASQRHLVFTEKAMIKLDIGQAFSLSYGTGQLDYDRSCISIPSLKLFTLVQMEQ